MGISGFAASNGWIESFKKQHNLHYMAIASRKILSHAVLKNGWKNVTTFSLLFKDIWRTTDKIEG